MTVMRFPGPSGEGVPYTRLERGPFFADIIMDKQSDPAVYITVVQQRGSPMVRAITQHLSMDEARESAEERLEKLAARVA